MQRTEISRNVLAFLKIESFDQCFCQKWWKTDSLKCAQDRGNCLGQLSWHFWWEATVISNDSHRIGNWQLASLFFFWLVSLLTCNLSQIQTTLLVLLQCQNNRLNLLKQRIPLTVLLHSITTRDMFSKISCNFAGPSPCNTKSCRMFRQRCHCISTGTCCVCGVSKIAGQFNYRPVPKKYASHDGKICFSLIFF